MSYIDIYKDDLNKLNKVYLRLIRLKSLSRIRHTYYKVQIEEYNLIYHSLNNDQICHYNLTLDTNKKA